MTRPSPSPEVRALLDRERELPPLPPGAKERALGRARAALAAGATAPQASRGSPPRMQWAAAIAGACALSAAASAATYEIRDYFAKSSRADAVASAPPASARPRSDARLLPNGALSPPAPGVAATPPAVTESLPAPTQAPLPRSPAPRPSQVGGTEGAELLLLRQAHAAVARGDFAAALPPIAEHARRFREGKLAEEREALRVKALAGLGRTEEARGAATAFRARFPRSVLSPAVSEMPAAEP